MRLRVLAATATRRLLTRPGIRSRLGVAFFALVTLACSQGISLADEGGVSFWLPGLFGSLAAVPQQPGWSLTTTYYHTTSIGWW